MKPYQIKSFSIGAVIVVIGTVVTGATINVPTFWNVSGAIFGYVLGAIGIAGMYWESRKNDIREAELITEIAGLKIAIEESTKKSLVLQGINSANHRETQKIIKEETGLLTSKIEELARDEVKRTGVILKGTVIKPDTANDSEFRKRVTAQFTMVYDLLEDKIVSQANEKLEAAGEDLKERVSGEGYRNFLNQEKKK